MATVFEWAARSGAPCSLSRMPRGPYTACLGIFGLCLGVATGCQPMPASVSWQPTEAVPGEVVVRFLDGTPDAERTGLRASHHASQVVVLSSTAELWRVPIGRERATCDALAVTSRVRFAHANPRRRSLVPFSAGVLDPVEVPTPTRVIATAHTGTPWQLSQAGFPDAWATTTGQGVTVAILDSGVDPEHPALKASLLPLVDEVSAMGRKDEYAGVDYAGRDGHGHGTHVTGLVIARTEEARVAGGAPGAKVLPVKVTPANGETDDATIARGIRDAADGGAKVINLSIGGPEPSPILLDALNEAFAQGVAVVMASGNDGRAVNFPAAYEGVISVGATTNQARVASYSSRGPSLVLVAPGGGAPGRHEGPGVMSTLPTYPTYLTQVDRKPTRFGTLSGTSMAAPLASAAAALLLSVEPQLPPMQVRTRLAAAAERLGAAAFDEASGYGQLHAWKALHGAADDGQLMPHVSVGGTP